MAETGLQNLTGYTEKDDNSHLTVIATKATGANVGRDEDVYCYDDFGADFFNDLTATFELYVAATSVPTAAAAAGFMGFANVVDDISGWAATDINVAIAEDSGGFKIYLERGAAVASDVYTGSADTIYYCLLERSADSDTATLKIYSNSARTTLLDTLTISGVGVATKWRYCYGFVSWNFPVADTEFDGYIANLKVYNATSGFAATYPDSDTDSLRRASGIRRSFWAGIGGQAVYQLEIALGGMSITYVSPISSRDIPSAVTPSEPTYSQADFQKWLQDNDINTVIMVFGHYPSYEEWLKFVVVK